MKNLGSPSLMTILTDEATELNPVDLYFLSGMRRDDFAELMGIQKQTLDTWCAGIREPSRQARRLAAEVHRNWKNAGRI